MLDISIHLNVGDAVVSKIDTDAVLMELNFY